jgi:hypothetical protein
MECPGANGRGCRRSPVRSLIWTLMDPVSCVSCVSWMYWVNAGETHETFHWESGMRYQVSSGPGSERESGLFSVAAESAVPSFVPSTACDCAARRWVRLATVGLCRPSRSQAPRSSAPLRASTPARAASATWVIAPTNHSKDWPASLARACCWSSVASKPAAVLTNWAYSAALQPTPKEPIDAAALDTVHIFTI